VITVSSKGHVIHSGITNDGHYTVPLPDFHAWSPDDPFLYDLYVSTDDDVVKSYFGMRHFSAAFDADGIMRFCLNHHPLFLSGLLDQGYSADGLMTYPSEEAMVYELQMIKDMGFNMLRKHVKIENRRWYSLCDHMGILVMQDMPSGGFSEYDVKTLGVLTSLGLRHRKDDGSDAKLKRSEASKLAFYEELDAMLDELYNVTSIFAWVPFNEGWGQFSSAQVTQKINQYDRTRLVDSASGWFDQGCGSFNSIHDYFFPFHANRKDQKRILLLSEFGGYAYLEWGHTTCEKLYGYRKFKDKKELEDAIYRLYEKMILANIRKGLSGCIFTQVSDVEDECNGLFTYDRKVLKVDPHRMKKMNERLYRRISK
jgi:beta-galactosidase/beta-glucuronidase